MLCSNPGTVGSVRRVSVAAGLLVLICGFIGSAQADQKPEVPREEPCSWGGIKCCFGDGQCECCPRGGKGSGKMPGEKDCQFREVTAAALPVSGYLASRDCLVETGPWSVNALEACQGELKWVELSNPGDLIGVEYSYVKCDDAVPFLVRTAGGMDRAAKTSWGSLKKLYR